MVKYFSKEKVINKVLLIDIDNIKPNKAQPRIIFDEKEIKSLSESIVQNGLLQPLTVRQIEDGYELISGERRLRALKLAGVKKAPSIILETSDRQSAIFALLENIQRSDLNFFEEAVAMKNMIVEWGISQQELADKVGKTQSAVANKLRLLRYPDHIKELMLNKGINERQARALLKIENESLLTKAILHITDKKLNVISTEKYIDDILSNQIPSKKVYKPVVKDVRIFFNTINKAVTVMNESGINASAKKIENEEFIEYIVRIPIVQTKISPAICCEI